MFDLVDQLYMGTLDVDRVNLSFNHLKQRLHERRVDFDFLTNLLFNEEMLGYTKSECHKNGFELFYSTPELEEYNRLKVCIKVFDDKINVMTVYGDD